MYDTFVEILFLSPGAIWPLLDFYLSVVRLLPFSINHYEMRLKLVQYNQIRWKCRKAILKIKPIKSYLGNIISQTRLNCLAIISIDNEHAKNLIYRCLWRRLLKIVAEENNFYCKYKIIIIGFVIIIIQ
jgi:hypothetical protein